MSTPNMGKVGIWSLELRFGDREKTNAVAAELDELGFGALWIPGGIDDQVLGDVDRLLAATRNMAIATGIINLWKQQPEDVANWFNGLSDAHKSRVMLGIGISHGPLIGEGWNKPIARTREYLDKLEAAGMAMGNTCLAALGPKMLALAAERTGGAHPYLVTPQHSAEARQILGPGKLLMPEQGVVFGQTREQIVETAKAGLANYQRLPNYCNNWKRLGFSDDDIENASDRLIDEILVNGSIEAMAMSVKAHHDAGADHVCVQIVSGSAGGDLETLRSQYRALAEALL